jgi:anthranilate phosphoribosyltransferase
VNELSQMGSTRICKSDSLQDIEDEEICSRDFWLKHAEFAELQGGDAKVNAVILEAIIFGQETGPYRDMVLMNSGAALACAGLANNFCAGLEISREMTTSGATLEKLWLFQK